MDIVGKSVLITGGAGGIGSDTARQLLLQGVDKLAIIDLADPNNVVSRLQNEFKEKTILFRKVDVRKRSDIDTLLEEIFRLFGGIDIVINNAGIADESEYEKVINVNLLGVVNVTYAAIELLSIEKGGKGGAIINVASTCGLDYIFSLPVYNATKHAIVGFTRSLADDFFINIYGIKFITVCPGVTATSLLQNIGKQLYRPDCAEETFKLLGPKKTQTAEACAISLVEVLKTSAKSSIWILDDSTFEEVTITKYWKN